MPEEKEKPAPSFTKLLRGGPSLGPESRPPASRPTDFPKKEEKRRRPIILPFQRQKGEEALFSVTYREWAFLLGVLLLLFGGMGLIRMFSPKETMTPSLAPFGEGEGVELSPEELSQGTRPPGGGDEEVISPLTARDTTRLVTPPPGFMGEKKEKPKSAVDSLKDSLWGGLREAERRTPPKPSLGGLGPSLAAALAGINAGPPSQGMRWMLPEELSARLRAIPTTSPRSREGMRLGYSGAQRIPGLGGARRSLASSSGERYGRMREAYQGPQAPEKLAAQAGAPFGETRAGGEPSGAGAGGASVSGETPKSDPGRSELGNYNVQRPPWATEEWKLQNWWRLAWTNALAEGLKTSVGEVAKGVGGAFGESFGNFLKCGTWDSSGCEPPAAPNLRQAWTARTCPSAIPEGYKVAELTLNYEGVPQQPGELPKGKVIVISRGEITEVTAGGEGGKQKTTKPDTQSRSCMRGAEPVLLTEEDIYSIRATGKTRGELLASAGVAQSELGEASPVSSAQGGEIRPGSAADIQSSLNEGGSPTPPPQEGADAPRVENIPE